MVASPSRGIVETLISKSQLVSQDLTDLKFQTQFFIWLSQKIQRHRTVFRNPVAVNLSRLSRLPINVPARNPSHMPQHDSGNDLLRESRKLREGIVASRRRDWFSILVYETSADLALESCDFSQLNSLLPHLVGDLYQNVSVTEQSDQQQRKDSFNDPIKFLLVDSSDLMAQRRLCFTRIMILLSLFPKFSMHEFLVRFQSFGDDHVSSAPENRFDDLFRIFKAIRRGNWIQFYKTTAPIIKFALNNDPSNHQTHWDGILLAHIFCRFQTQVVWSTIRKSYYSLNNDEYLWRCLGLGIVDNKLTVKEKKAELDDWFGRQGMQRTPTGAVILK